MRDNRYNTKKQYKNELTPTMASTTAWYPLRKRVASISNSWFSWINFSIRWASSSTRSLGTDAPRLLHNWMTEVGIFHRVHQSSKLSLHDDVLDDAWDAWWDDVREAILIFDHLPPTFSSFTSSIIQRIWHSLKIQIKLNYAHPPPTKTKQVSTEYPSKERSL